MRDCLELLVVILNYKTPSLVIECLETVLPELCDNQEIVVVDNNSSDNSRQVFDAWRERNPNKLVEFIFSTKNGGFSAGNNIGIKSRDAEFYLLLNSDTLLRPSSLSPLVKTMRENSNLGMVSPRLTWPDGEPQISCFKFHSPLSELINAAATSVITRLLNRWNVPIAVSKDQSSPEWTSFACVLVRRALIEEVGYMDEGYFLYYEDTDFCFQSKKLGWKILNCPSSEVVHLRGGSSDVKKNQDSKKRQPKYFYESRSRYFAKNYGYAGLLGANLLWMGGRMISKTRELIGKKEIAANDSQWKDIWIGFRRPLKGQKMSD